MMKTFLFATTALIATIAPVQTQNLTIIEDRSELPLLNPDLKDRETLKLRLANGLEVMIISDSKADQSAASIAVSTGSWNDPLEYPGMAHFCEHMLFMGTEKYPSENEFFSSMSNYAGVTNAFTAPNRTVYMFAAQTDGFLGLLDRFGHFFIDPLFNPGNIARELHAVDQEYAKNVENDAWREYMVFKETGNPSHPNRMFSTGNSETLGKIPQNALVQWHKQNYGADRMHLVLYSPLPLQTLKEVAVEIFSQVPTATSPLLDHSKQLSSERQICHITYIKPIKNKRTLTLSWELPLYLSEDENKAAELVAYALKRGQENSLFQYLKREMLVDSLSVRVDELGGKQHKFFQIVLELTQAGIEQIESIILNCFEAIAGLRETGVPEYLFDEKKRMSQLNYQYQGREDPFEFIRSIGDSIADEELSTYPRKSILATSYDTQTIADTLSLLTPSSCAISILASPEITKVVPDKKEKWLGAEYAIRRVPDEWMDQWMGAQPNPQILLAKQNPFVPTDLNLVENFECSSIPTLIADNEIGQAFYIRSPEFGAPESIYYIHIFTPKIDSSAKNEVLTSLYIDHFTDMIHPLLAQASEAGLQAHIDQSKGGLRIQISGFSEKAPLFLQQIVEQMPLNPPTEEQFAIYKARHEKAYENGQKELAFRQAKELLDSIVNQDKTTKKQKLHALLSIEYEDFLSFHQNLFETTYIQALFSGNLSQKEAESAWLDVVHALNETPYPKELHPKTKILQLSGEAGPFVINQKTEVQGNAAILLIDEGNFTFERRAAQEVLSAIVKEAFFNELRTKQKTGYIAHSDCLELEEHLFQIFIVQSNSHQPEDLLYRFEQFIEEFNDSLTENISVERFVTLKASQISSLKNRFRNLEDKSALWDRLAFQQDGDFQFIEKRISALEALNYDEFMAQSQIFFSRENRKRLAVLYEGKLSSPFAYHPIAIPQIIEVATYAPKKMDEEGEYRK